MTVQTIIAVVNQIMQRAKNTKTKTIENCIVRESTRASSVAGANSTSELAGLFLSSESKFKKNWFFVLVLRLVISRSFGFRKLASARMYILFDLS